MTETVGPVGPPDTILGLLTLNRQHRPDRPAVLGAAEQVITHAALAEQVDYVRRTLSSWGFGLTDRVAIAMPTGADSAACLLGVMSVAVAAPLNPELKTGEFAFYLSDLDARALLVPRAGLQAARTAAADAGIPVIEVSGPGADPTNVFTLDLVEKTASRGSRGNPPKSQDLALLLHTSGTTARPKLVAITHGALLGKASNAVAVLQLNGDDRCFNIMPLFHGHGIYDGLIAPLLAGGSTIPAPFQSIDQFYRLLESLRPTWLTASFAMHRMILENSGQNTDKARKSGLRLLRSGSGALDSETGRRLKTLFGTPMIVTYATTETGIVAANEVGDDVVSGGLAVCTAAEDLIVRADDGTAAAPGEIGEIIVKGPHVSDYADNGARPETTGTDGWLGTGDLGQFDAQGRLHIVGRRKEIINRGGEKISPAEIDAILARFPGVKAAGAFPVPHRTLGQEVAAAVVPEKGTTLDIGELKAFVGTHLAPFKIPRRIFITESLPVTSTGKIRRADLATRFAIEQTPGNRRDWRSGDQGRVERILARIWADELGLKRVGPEENFFLLGGDSLQAVHVFEEIERKFGRQLPSSALFEAGTVREMAQLIVESGVVEPIFPLRAAGSAPPLFIAPGGGGNIITFRQIVPYIDPEWPVFALQPMGLWQQSDTLLDIEKTATVYLEEMLKICPQGPFFVAGYSFGGLVAHELAAQIQARGLEVGLLILIDSYLKNSAFEFGPRAFAERHVSSLSDIFRNPARLMRFAVTRLRNIWTYGGRWLSVQRFKQTQKKAQSRGGEIPTPLRSVRNAQLVARQRFKPKIFHGDVVLFAATDDELRPPRAFDRWPNVLALPLSIEYVPGNHNSMLRKPHARYLAEAINERLSTSYKSKSVSTLTSSSPGEE